jgi:hypothetical protein
MEHPVLTYQRIFCLGFYKILCLATERMHDLYEEMLRPFVDACPIKHQLHEGRPTTQAEHKFKAFVHALSNVCLAGRDLILGDARSADVSQIADKLISTTAAEIEFRPFLSSRCCHFCFPNSTDVIGEFRGNKLSCSEFLVRHRQLTMLHRRQDHLEQHSEDLRKERNVLSSLLAEIMAKAFLQLPRVLCFDDEILSRIDCFIHSVINEVTFGGPRDSYVQVSHQRYDCLGRISAHQWLDVIGSLDDAYDWQSNITTFASLNVEIIDHQDFLGRTLLHKFCHRRWDEGIEWLLSSGANPGAVTSYGSLPLHYAAANGSLSMCRMLLDYKVKFDINHRDSAGFSAIYYAELYKYKEITDLLSEALDVQGSYIRCPEIPTTACFWNIPEFWKDDNEVEPIGMAASEGGVPPVWCTEWPYMSTTSNDAARALTQVLEYIETCEIHAYEHVVVGRVIDNLKLQMLITHGEPMNTSVYTQRSDQSTSALSRILRKHVDFLRNHVDSSQVSLAKGSFRDRIFAAVKFTIRTLEHDIEGLVIEANDKSIVCKLVARISPELFTFLICS